MSAAHLMAALAERQVIDAGLDWVICEIDSLAIAKPDAMDVQTFLEKASAVVDWFRPLKPYRTPGSILKIGKEANKWEEAVLADDDR